MEKETLKYSYLNLFIRACFFNLSIFILTIVYGLLALVYLIFPLPRRIPVLLTYIRACSFLIEKVYLIEVEVQGREHIPQDQNGIILCKHQSAWEAFYLAQLFNVPSVISKRELLWLPFFGWGLAASNPIGINRKNKKEAMRQIFKKGKQALKAGRWVLIFPEGTRTPYGQKGTYKLGGARLAAETGFPVLPVAHNAGYFWPKGQFVKKPGTVKLVFGPMIETKGRTPEEILQLAQEWIETTMTQIDSFIDKSTR